MYGYVRGLGDTPTWPNKLPGEAANYDEWKQLVEYNGGTVSFGWPGDAQQLAAKYPGLKIGAKVNAGIWPWPEKWRTLNGVTYGYYRAPTTALRTAPDVSQGTNEEAAHAVANAGGPLNVIDPNGAARSSIEDTIKWTLIAVAAAAALSVVVPLARSFHSD